MSKEIMEETDDARRAKRARMKILRAHLRAGVS